MDMLRRIGKLSGESVESLLKKKKATEGRISGKEGFALRIGPISKNQYITVWTVVRQTWSESPATCTENSLQF